MSPASLPPRPRPEPRRRGFSLVELIVTTAVAGIVLGGVMSSVLMINRSGFLLGNYIDMEKQARSALETLATDARVTQANSWTYDASKEKLTAITLTTPSGDITYAYNSDAGTLTRKKGSATITLVTGIQSLTFTAYKYDEIERVKAVDPTTTSLTDLNNVTKMVQVSLSAVRSRSTLADATNNVVSARYVLRNKPQS